MKVYSTSERLNSLMKERNLKQADILRMCEPYMKKLDVRLGRNDLSQYVSGKFQPKQDKLTVLGMALNVSEAWLMGYDVPMERIDKVNKFESDSEKSNSEENTYKHIGFILNALRMQNNKTLEEIAEEMHIPADLILDYENATKKIPLNILIEFAKHYKVSIDDLIGLKFNDVNNTTFITTDKKMADQYRKWNEQIGYANKLTDEEIDKIISYTKFLISERKQ